MLLTNIDEYWDLVRKWICAFFCFFKTLTIGEVKTRSPMELNLTIKTLSEFDTSVKLKKLSNIA